MIMINFIKIVTVLMFRFAIKIITIKILNLFILITIFSFFPLEITKPILIIILKEPSIIVSKFIILHVYII